MIHTRPETLRHQIMEALSLAEVSGVGQNLGSKSPAVKALQICALSPPFFTAMGFPCLWLDRAWDRKFAGFSGNLFGALKKEM